MAWSKTDNYWKTSAFYSKPYLWMCQIFRDIWYFIFYLICEECREPSRSGKEWIMKKGLLDPTVTARYTSVKRSYSVIFWELCILILPVQPYLDCFSGLKWPVLIVNLFWHLYIATVFENDLLEVWCNLQEAQIKTVI